MNKEKHTDLYTVKTKVETGKHHLTETKAGAKGGEEADGENGKNIEEKDGEKGVDESKVKHRYGQRANGEGRDYHIGGTPLFIAISFRQNGWSARFLPWSPR